MSAVADPHSLSNAVCIVGVDESDEMGNLPGKSQLTLHLEAIRNAVHDAGLKSEQAERVAPVQRQIPHLGRIHDVADGGVRGFQALVTRFHHLNSLASRRHF